MIRLVQPWDLMEPDSPSIDTTMAGDLTRAVHHGTALMAAGAFQKLPQNVMAAT
jgi:hypothetical protein